LIGSCALIFRIITERIENIYNFKTGKVAEEIDEIGRSKSFFFSTGI
jgi:hypothetical protein